MYIERHNWSTPTIILKNILVAQQQFLRFVCFNIL